MSEYDHEPTRGLPIELPDGEIILWQGSPRWQSLAVHFCHVRSITLYFAILIAWRLIVAHTDKVPVAEAAATVSLLAMFAGIMVGLLCLFAWAVGGTTIYTITNRRIVLRYGIALTKAVNVPLNAVGTAGLRLYGDGSGDIAISLVNGKLAYLILWPHARPWSFRNPEPMLRGISDPARVSLILKNAVSAIAPLAGENISSHGRGSASETAASPKKSAPSQVAAA